MDSLSDSSRCELDSVTSSDSLHLFTDEFRLRHLVSPDVTSAELCKRVAALELENERLRVDVENTRIEANARNASNQGLKSKIAELFVDAQTALQEKQRLQNALKDASGRLAAAENSSKWYRSKLHDSQANEKARQMEIDTYQGILRQRQQNLADMTAKCKQFGVKYAELAAQFKKDKRQLREEIETLRSEKESCRACREGNTSRQIAKDASSDLLEFKLEAMEKSSEECHAQLRAVEQRLASSEISRNSAETSLSKYRWLMSSMEENNQKLEAERSETDEKLRETRAELQKLRQENEELQVSALSSKRERAQVEDAIVQLRCQLSKMLAQHKLLKSRNAEAERKLTIMQDLQNENKRLKALSYAANNSLFKKLKEEKRRVKNLEAQLRREKARFHTHEELPWQIPQLEKPPPSYLQSDRSFSDKNASAKTTVKTTLSVSVPAAYEQLSGRAFSQRDKTMASMRDCLRKTVERNKELQERLKSKMADESIDEGYGDSSIASSGSVDLPSAPPLDSVLIMSAIDVLSRSKNFMGPMQTSLDELSSRLEEMRQHRYAHAHVRSVSLSRDYSSNGFDCVVVQR